MTAFEILKSGGKIVFLSGYILKGDPENNYIDCGYEFCGIYYSDGLRILDKNGTALAIKDAKSYAKREKSHA